jgi:hypothetical protein
MSTFQVLYVFYNLQLAMNFIVSRFQVRLGGILDKMRCFYIRLVLQMEFTHKLDLFIHCYMINLRFVSPTYRSLALISCLAVLTLCYLLFLLTFKACPSCVIHDRSYLLQSYKTLIFANAAKLYHFYLLSNIFEQFIQPFGI